MHGIGGSKVSTKGSMEFHFLFGGKMYSVSLYTLPGDDPMILSHRDMDKMGLNYQSFWKVIERVADSYSEPVAMRHNLPFLVFEKWEIFKKSTASDSPQPGASFNRKALKRLKLRTCQSIPDSSWLVLSSTARRVSSTRPNRGDFYLHSRMP